MSSDSSSEEDVSKFREAADTSLYNDSLFKEKSDVGSESVSEDQVEKLTQSAITAPSLRYVEEDEDRIHNDLRVTPSFQKHVAKHLSNLLDSNLNLNDGPDEKTGSPDKMTKNVLKAKRRKTSDSSVPKSNGGVRLFGASAVFLSNMNLVPAPQCRRKRRRKAALCNSDNDSSSEDSDNENMKKISAAAVSANWILNGDATRGWVKKEGKIEKCAVNESGCLVPLKNEPDSSYSNPTKVSNKKMPLNMAYSILHHPKKLSHDESELAASFKSVVSIGSESTSDVPSKMTKKEKKKKKKKKRRMKELYSEDATTETTEVEDVVEKPKKRVKKSHKKAKYQEAEKKPEELKTEKVEMMDGCPQLFEEGRVDKKKKQKRKKLKKEKKKSDDSLLKKSHSKLSRVHKRCSKKKMKKNIRHLSEDLAKLMMTPNDSS